MLVLERRVGSSVLIGQDIVVHVTEVRGDKVRLGITAPEHMLVLRNELAVASDPGEREAQSCE